MLTKKQRGAVRQAAAASWNQYYNLPADRKTELVRAHVKLMLKMRKKEIFGSILGTIAIALLSKLAMMYLEKLIEQWLFKGMNRVCYGTELLEEEWSSWVN